MKKEILLVSLLVLCSCNSNTNNESKAESSIIESSSIAIESSSTTIESSTIIESSTSTNNAPFEVYLTTEDILNVDIHTELQQKYFKGIVSSATSHAKGIAELSKPQPVTVSWFMDDYDVPSQYLSTFEKFNFYLYDDETLTNPRIFEIKDDLSISIDNLYLNHTHYYEVEAVFGEYTFKSETKKIVTKDGIIRNLNVDGITNVRDLGNYKTDDNKRVKQGLLFRSGRFNTNYTETKEITEKGIDTMLNYLKINTEVDLRADSESGYLTSSVLGDSVIYKKIDYAYYINDTFNMLYDSPNKSGIRDFFKLLANEASYPIDYHCSIGTDRTGFLSFLLLAFLGVSEEECYRDYLFSNYGNIGSSRTKEEIENYLVAKLNQRVEGNTLKEKVTNFLLDIGLTNDILYSVRNNLLEDNS